MTEKEKEGALAAKEMEQQLEFERKKLEMKLEYEKKSEELKKGKSGVQETRRQSSQTLDNQVWRVLWKLAVILE